MQDYWQEIGALEGRMDDMLRGLGAQGSLAFPSLPLFVRKPSCRRSTSSSVTTAW